MNNIPNILKESNFNQQKIQNLFTDSNLDVNSDDFGVLNFSQNEVTDESSLSDFLLTIKTEKRKIVPPKVETFTTTDIIEYQEEIISFEQPDIEDNSELSTIEEDVDMAISNEQMLQAQIDELSSKLDEEMAQNIKFREDSAEMYLAARDTILSQRINSGEGVNSDDFEDVFPFLPKISKERNEAAQRVETFPFMGTNQ
jgi:hypothetical protein